MSRLVILLLTLAAIALAPPGRAAADPLEPALLALDSGSFADKEAAVAALAAILDERVVTILAAMGEGRLFRRKEDQRFVVGAKVGRQYELSDALSGEALGTESSRALTKVKVNNKLRGLITGLLGSLELGHPDPAKRLAAVEGMLRRPSAETIERLRATLEGESDAAVRAAIADGIAAADLASDDPETRLAAIAVLAELVTPQALALLSDTARTAESDEVRAAAQAAVDRIEVKRAMLGLAANLYQGISLGSILLLAAIGLAITFGVMGVINMAHGEMIMIGAYATFVVQEVFRHWLPPALFDAYLIAAIPVAFVVAGTAGIAIERGVIRFLYGRPLETLLATWGLSLILQQTVRSIFGAPNREVANPSWMSGGIELIGGIVLTYNRLVIILFCLVVLGAVAALLRYSNFGLQMRAVTQNRATASTMGIDTNRIDALTFGLGSGVAGMGGVAPSQIGNVSPNLGQLYIVDSFMVVVFGGVGNLAGTFVGAMTLGVINKFLEPVAGAVLGKVVVLALIILFIQRRPRGLFALKGRAVEA